MNEMEPKRLIVCMVESMPEDETLPAQGIVLTADTSTDTKKASDRLSVANVLAYKGLEVSNHVNKWEVGYWGTYLN